MCVYDCRPVKKVKKDQQKKGKVETEEGNLVVQIG